MWSPATSTREPDSRGRDQYRKLPDPDRVAASEPKKKNEPPKRLRNDRTINYCCESSLLFASVVSVSPCLSLGPTTSEYSVLETVPFGITSDEPEPWKS